jgi:hypothetical protein
VGQPLVFWGGPAGPGLTKLALPHFDFFRC